jgi:hypothetical protein
MKGVVEYNRIFNIVDFNIVDVSTQVNPRQIQNS